MSQKLTSFVFFKNTPLTDFQNTIHFESDEERDNFFLEGNHYTTLPLQADFNFIRDRSTLRVRLEYWQMEGVNYCTFLSQFDSKRYYAYVLGYEYLNSTIEIRLLIDPIMTYTQGTILHSLGNLKIERQHLDKANYNRNLLQIRTNDDILKTTTKRYVKNELYNFKDYYIVFTSASDLRVDFGTENKPKFISSEGRTYDRITSPLDIYVCKQSDFNELMKKIQEYSWVTQNINKVLLIPEDFINEADLFSVTVPTVEFDKLYTFMNDSVSNDIVVDKFNYSQSELCELYGLDPQKEMHLLRSEYTTCEFYSWDGQQLLLDNAFYDENIGLRFRGESVIGYINRVAFYPVAYKSDTTKENFDNNIQQGTYLNNAIIFDNFDEIPILIDNYNLSLANNANQRQLAEDKLITNRVSNIFDSNADPKSRFMDAASILSNFSVTSLFGKFTDEYEYYRTQKAQFADLALASPTITSQARGNAFQIKKEIYGITMKLSAPDENELNKIRKYYSMFGFQLQESGVSLAPVNSMSICNYLQFSGNWTLPNIDISLLEMMKSTFETGVRFWHNNNTPNPMVQNILDNEMRF